MPDTNGPLAGPVILVPWPKNFTPDPDSWNPPPIETKKPKSVPKKSRARR